MGEEWFECWCYAKKKTVSIAGKITPGSIAQALTVARCDQEVDCDKVRSLECLIGKKREARWKPSSPFEGYSMHAKEVEGKVA